MLEACPMLEARLRAGTPVRWAIRAAVLAASQPVYRVLTGVENGASVSPAARTKRVRAAQRKHRARAIQARR